MAPTKEQAELNELYLVFNLQWWRGAFLDVLNVHTEEDQALVYKKKDNTAVPEFWMQPKKHFITYLHINMGRGETAILWKSYWKDPMKL